MENRFCTQCGARTVSGARFCVECGRALDDGASSSRRTLSLERYSPLAVFGAVVIIGAAAVLSGALTAAPPPVVPSGGGPVPQNAALPQGHPPIGLPDDVREALDRLAETVEQDPENLEGWKQLGFAQYRAGQLDPTYLEKSATTFTRVLERDPDDLDALRTMGNVTFDQNDPSEAIGYYKRYLALEPDDLHVETDLGTMYLASKNVDEALRTYQDVLARDPRFFQAQFNLAIAYRADGRNDEALSALERAREVADSEETRQRVDALLAHLTGGHEEEAAVQPADGLRADVESVLRTHPIAGSRVDRFDWTDESTVRVILRDFPMDGMPPEVREMFADRLKSGLEEQKKKHGRTEAIEMVLVDAASGRVMETISQ